MFCFFCCCPSRINMGCLFNLRRQLRDKRNVIYSPYCSPLRKSILIARSRSPNESINVANSPPPHLLILSLRCRVTVVLKRICIRRLMHACNLWDMETRFRCSYWGQRKRRLYLIASWYCRSWRDIEIERERKESAETTYSVFSNTCAWWADVFIWKTTRFFMQPYLIKSDIPRSIWSFRIKCFEIFKSGYIVPLRIFKIISE